MIPALTLNKTESSVLLRIVGSRQGADLDAIVKFEQTHHRRPATVEQIREALVRLITAGYVTQTGKQYFSEPELQSVFFDEVRNCRDTIEEFDMLDRVLARVAGTPPARED